MKKHIQSLTLCSLMTIVMPVFANVGAVIDSGVDFSHSKLAPIAWVNNLEVAGNKIDDDKNGKIDDVNGWNFLTKDGNVFESEMNFQDEMYAKFQLFFELQDKDERGLGTLEDLLSMRMIAKDLGPYLDYFGTLAHGTHVSGIMSKGNTKSEIMALKIISTDVESFTKDGLLEWHNLASKPKLSGSALRRFLMKWMLGRLGRGKAKELKEFAVYVKEANARVANCSWGVGYEGLEQAVIQVAAQIIGPDVPADEIAFYTRYLFEKMNNKGERMMDKAPNTLFVFAAGNDNSEDFDANNDERPNYPANADSDNTITVAATIDSKAIASFSNYGAKTVHVAAAGVGILSTTPQNKMTKMSGTSMAAPFVSNIALNMTEANDSIEPKEMKEILMATVDKKDFLKGKVVSGGIVNPERAIKAAAYLKSNSLKKAIALSFKDIPASSSKSGSKEKEVSKEIRVSKLPSLFH
ncbi:MAG: S8 family serine peptidase [Bacteriovoracaceae bacterium]